MLLGLCEVGRFLFDEIPRSIWEVSLRRTRERVEGEEALYIGILGISPFVRQALVDTKCIGLGELVSLEWILGVLVGGT